MCEKKVIFYRSFAGIALFLFAFLGANAQTTYFSRASTAWNLNTTWSTIGYGGAPAVSTPDAGDIVNIGNGNTVTITAAAACATITIDNGATLNISQTIAVSGTSTVNGTLSINSIAGTKAFTGLVTIGVGGTWNEAANEAIIFRGGITNNGTFTAGTGIHTFNTNSQVLTGTFTIPRVTVTGAAVTLTNTNSLTVNTALSGTGRIIQGTGATLNIGGTSGITNMTATASGNTVNYTGAGQTIHNNGYANLSMSGSGVKNLQSGITSITENLTLDGSASTTAVAALTIGGNVTLGNGTSFTAGAFTHNVAGDWINNGSTFTGTGSVINFNGGAQNIGGSSSTTFDFLQLSGSGTKTFSASTTISDELSIESGVLAGLSNVNTYTANTLVLAGALQGAGTWGSTASSPAAANQNDSFFSGNGLITVNSGGFTFYSIASSDWSLTSTWSTIGFGGAAASSTPGPGDYVIIGDGQSVTITDDEVCEVLLFDASTAQTNSLLINSGSLTVTSDITIPQTVTSGSNILSAVNGDLIAENLNFTASGGGAGHQLIISTGTVSINGDITGIGASSTIQFTGAGLLEVGGSMFSSANGTLTSVAGSTVSYTGATQTVQALGYNNLILSGGGTKTLAGTTAVDGNLLINDGVTFTIGAFTFSVAGTTTVGSGTSGALSITSATGTKTFSGLVTVDAGGTWTNTTEGVTFRGGITNNGTFTAGTGIHTFNTNSQVLTGTFTIPRVTVTGAAVTLTNTNSLTVNTALSGTGRIIQGTGATLNIGGTSGITNMTATASGNTVNYTGAAQTVNNVNYENLGLSGSGAKTLQVGTTTITGDLTLSGTVSTTAVIGLSIGGTVDIGSGTTFEADAFTHTVGGDWINDGTFISTGVINFNGAAQNISGGAITFYDLILSGSGIKTFGSQVTITNDFFINSVVADLGSITTHTANRLILDGVLQGTTNQTWGSTASGANVQNDIYFLNPSTGLITIAVGGTNFYSSASADWGVNTTWSNVSFGGPMAAGTPGPTDFVFIGGGFSVSVSGTEVCSAISFDAGTSVTNTLTISSSGSLTVSGTITIPQTITSGQNNLDVGAGNLVADNIAFTTGSPGGTGHRMTISTGTATINGNVTGTGTSSLIVFTDAGLLQLGEGFYTSANGTLTTVAGSTVEYNGTDQTIESHTTYRNLTLSGSGNKTLSASTNTTVGGNLVVNDNTTFLVGGSTLAVTGSTTVGGGSNGALSITSATGTKTFSGLVTISSGATWTNTIEGVTFRGGITNDGIFTAGTGVHTFNTNSQVLTGTFTIPSVTVTGAAVTLTNTNSLTVNTALSGTGGIIQGTGATLNIGGTSGITNMTASASGNTVNYTGAAQTVKNVNYENLGLSGSGAKTLQVGTTTITGDLTLSGTVTTTGVIGLSIGGSIDIGSGTTFSSGPFIHNIGGNFINNGSFGGGTGTIGFVGSAPQTISGTTETNFNNIFISNTSGVSVESNQNLIGVLTLAASSQFDADGSSNTAIFTLLSSGEAPTQDASIATLPAGASVTGNVTVQRYMEIEGANSGRIYRYISSPVQAAPVSQIQTEIPVTGSFTGSSVCSGCGSTQSMFLYNESVITDTNGSGGNNFDDGFEDFPAASNSEILTSGRGYALFVRGNIDPVLSNGSARWDVRGVINSGTIDYTPFTTFTSSGDVANDGWNLVGNPYPSTIDWDAASGWTRTNINNAIYMRDNGLVSPVYASYVGGVGTNGGSRYIAIGQAYYVKSDGGAINFQSDENVKVGGTQTTFFREGGVSDIIRIALKRDGNKDETVIRFSEGASLDFDKDMDAVKLPNAIFNLSTVSGTNKYAINSIPSLSTCSTSIQLNISNAAQGNYQLDFSDLSSFASTPVVSLLDSFTGQSVAISDEMTYEFVITSDANSSGNRFSIMVEQPPINLLIDAQGAENICVESAYSIILAASEQGVKYFASVNGNSISESVNGTGGELILNVFSDKLALGENTITLYAQRNGCTALALSNSVNVLVDGKYEIQSVTDGVSCNPGQVTLKATGAPANGFYRWYDAENATEALAETGEGTLITPVLDKTKTYYVSAVNSLGCEGGRMQVKATVENFTEAEISETAYGVLTSNYTSGNKWYFNNELIPGANGQSISIDQSGLYRVEVAIGNCIASDEFEFVVTGVERNMQEVIYYPNPIVNDKLFVTVEGLNLKRIEIISNTGSPVGQVAVNATDTVVELDFEGKPTGLYLIKLSNTRNTVSTFKIIKQ